MKFNWKIGGEAGFGIMTTGMAVSKIATRAGYHIFDYNEYPSLIRGGHNTYEVVIADEEVHAMQWKVDLLICLNKETYLLHKHRLTSASLVMYDPDDITIDDNVIKIPTPFKKLKAQFEIHQMMVNTIAVGATIAILGGDINIFYTILTQEFAKKGDEVIEFNKKLAAAGYDYILENHKDKVQSVLAKRSDSPKAVMTANDAFSLAAVAADCRYYAAYPMTPSSTILTTLAAWQVKTAMVVRHSEDEIAVINSALGASFGGVRSAVGTSGGGFALMVEALSYAGVAEIPVVVYLGQRPGPATGLPTWTEQGDLLFAVHAGHGEFPKIVLAPGDIEEMVELTTKAFDLADIYQTPVIIVSDKLIGESHRSYLQQTLSDYLSKYQPDYGKKVMTTNQKPYLRYKDSDDGISELLIPGQKGVFYQSNSYEHTEDSHTTESSEDRIQQVTKRNRKWQSYFAKHFQPPIVFGDLNSASIVLVSWGGNKGVILEAQKLLQEQGVTTAYIHFTHVYPMDEEKVRPFFNHDKRYLLIENNSHAQFNQLLRMQTGIQIEEKLLKYDGRPFFPEEIVEYVVKGKSGESKEVLGRAMKIVGKMLKVKGK